MQLYFWKLIYFIFAAGVKTLFLLNLTRKAEFENLIRVAKAAMQILHFVTPPAASLSVSFT